MQLARHSCNQLLKELQPPTHARPSKQTLPPKKKPYLLKAQSILQRKVGPEDEEQNKRIIEKIRKRFHKKPKEQSIKKTDLGEDHHIFTAEQMAKLQVIDQCQVRGIPYNQTAEETDEVVAETAVDRLRKLGRIDSISQEIKSNLEWGELKGNPYQTCYFKVKEKQGFMSRATQSVSKMSVRPSKQPRKSDKTNNHRSLNQFFHTALNKKPMTGKLWTSDPMQSWGKETKSEMTLSEKLQAIKLEAERHVQRVTSNEEVFMTETRKKAIYECQVIRLAKKVLGPKHFSQLTLTVDDKQNQEAKEEGKQEIRRAEKDERRCQAQEVLSKNYGRIRAQRKRVIEKMLC